MIPWGGLKPLITFCPGFTTSAMMGQTRLSFQEAAKCQWFAHKSVVCALSAEGCLARSLLQQRDKVA